MKKIDSTARIGKEVALEEGVEIGPYSILKGEIKVGAHTKIGAFTVIEGNVEIGSHCNIGHHVVIGTPPQDLSYQGEKTQVIIGERTTLREFVTVHRATGEGKATSIGDDCFIMAYCHIAHNCYLGNGITMANNSTLAGYVEIEDLATLSGWVGVHQFVRLGKLVMIGGLSKVVMDIPPYTLADGHPARIFGLNMVGMKRRGIEGKKREEIHQIYNLIYHSNLSRSKALEELKRSTFDPQLVEEIVDFWEKSKRGVARWVKGRKSSDEENASFSW
ncbi:MAG TPA: acyl-ACP--UDP-N-acetylglucosamine O-acyltransferase [Candidatus Atribacteria bacterium]|nr:acyl-ACP--UDP-N-acetylglucosamine O-acyltransferase [Candidatus Atribacteria bacterium]